MQTGENEQGLRKILDMTRLISIILLMIHCYYFCYEAFLKWGYTAPIIDRFLNNLYRSGLLADPFQSKLLALGFLVVSLLGVQGRKQEDTTYRKVAWWLLIGLFLYFGSHLLLLLKLTMEVSALLYMSATAIGFILILTAGTLFSRVIKKRLNQKDIFNKEAETFPQEERLLENEYSINLPTRYNWKGKWSKGWINIINPFRGLLVLGTPGSGKSYFIIQNVIAQHLQKGFAMFIYDFKFDDLTRFAYNHYLKNRYKFKVPPQFYVINFEDLSRSHRCNPLDPNSMTDITDATESARTILLGLNREWIRRQGDFFVESAINFLTAIIWFLRKYHNGEFCTLPHVIELMQVEYDSLFTILRTEKDIEVLINPFINAYLNDAMEQLEGQIAAAKIAMARLSSPQLYYVLSGNDFTLDINNEEEPKIVCIGNSPQKIQIYGAVISLYVSRLIKSVNRKGKQKCSLIFDEFPTIYLNNMDSLIATARSNKVATCVGVQDLSQLRKDYGKEQADVIMNITGNVISGQVTGDTAKQLSDRFGKIMQDRESLSINRYDTSINHSKQLEAAIPPSKIAALSSGEFVGMVADDPSQKIELKIFCGSILNDNKRLLHEEGASQAIPVIRKITPIMIFQNFAQIREEIKSLTSAEMDRILGDPAIAGAIVKRN